MPALNLDQVSYRIGDTPILNGVSLSVDEGEYLSIIGPNGAGKTTLLRCVNRIVKLTGGEISVLGKALESYTQRNLAKVLSYVPQTDGRYFPFHVYEFVLMGRYPHLSPFSTISPEDKQIVDNALEQTGIAAFADRSLATLSGGERQKVFIAAALAQGARILLLDEPTTFLDYKHQVEVTDLLLGLNRDKGMTILSVTHDVNHALWTSNRILALKDGEVLTCESPGELLEGETLQILYETPFDIVGSETGKPPFIAPRRIRS